MINKFIAGFALLVVSFGGGYGLSTASSYNYHLYQLQRIYADERVHSDRISPYNHRHTRSQEIVLRKAYNLLVNDARYSDALSRPQNSQDYRQSRHEYKLARPSLYPRYDNIDFSSNVVTDNVVRHQNRIATSDAIAQNTTSLHKNSSVVQANEFVAGSRLLFTRDENDIYRSKDTSLAFRIVRGDSGLRCTRWNFTYCANLLSNNFRNQNNLTHVYDYNYSYWQNHVLRHQQTIQNSFEYYPVTVEGFTTVRFGQPLVYFVYSVWDPSSESVVRVEAVSQANEADQASQHAKEIFDSFRLIIS